MKLKNTLALSLAAVMAAGLTACGSGSNSFTWFVDSIPANLDPPPPPPPLLRIPPQPRALRPPLTPPPRTATVTPPP